MNTREFLETVWGPSDGFFCIAEPFQKPDMKRPSYRHWVFDNKDDAIVFVKQNRDRADMFFAVHTLHQKKMWDPAKFNSATKELGADAVRIHPNMKMARALFFDLDVGEGDKKYPTREDAISDLQRFLFLTGLPDPLVTSSGGGYHVYWLLKLPIASPKWRVLAGKLHSIAMHFGMKHDPMRTTDQSSVLRVADTWNFKKSGKRPVKVLHPGVISDNKQFRARIEQLLAEHNVPLVSAAKGTGKALFVPKHVQDAASNIGSTVFAYNGTVTPLPAAARTCGQLKHYIHNQATASEPLWYNMLGLIAPTRRGDKWVHKLSSQHPQYSAAATDMKLRQYQLKTGGQPPTCVKIEAVSGNTICQSCPLYGKSKNPLMATNGIMLKQAQPTQVDDPVRFDDPPKPFTIGKGVIKTKMVDKLQVDEKVSPYVMFPYEDYDKTGGEPAFSLWWGQTLKGEWKSIRVDRRWYQDQRTLLTELANEGFIIDQKQATAMVEYMIAYIKKLNEFQRANKQYAHLGWTEERTKFIMADRVISNDGSSRPAVLSDRAKPALAWISKKGDRQKQIDAMEFYNADKYLAHQFAILCGLGSILMAATEYGGVVLSLAGDTSASKSTALYAIAALYGPPKDYVLDGTQNGSTTGARMERIATLSNYPVLFDELTHIGVEEALNFVMAISQFKDRQRLTNKGVLIPGRVEDKALIAVVSTNMSLHQLISQNNRAGTAGTVRVNEIPLKSVGVADKIAADQFRYTLQENHGHVGEEFIEAIVPVWPQVEQKVREVERKLFAQWNMATPERYYAAMSSAALVAGKIAVKMGLLPFDIKKIENWLTTEQIPHLQNVIKVAKKEIDPLTIMSNYVAHINGDILHVNDGSASGGFSYFEGTYAPRDIKAHYEMQTKQLWLRKDAFRTYCDQIGRNALSVIDTLTKSGIITADKKFQLGKGTKADLGVRPYCVRLDMTHKAMSGTTAVMAPPHAPVTSNIT